MPNLAEIAHEMSFRPASSGRGSNARGFIVEAVQTNIFTRSRQQ